MMRFPISKAFVTATMAMSIGCARARPVDVTPGAPRPSTTQRSASPLASARQMVLVVTPDWSTTSGSLRRFTRESDGAAWRPVGEVVPVVVGRTGLAWDDAQTRPVQGEPVKREGDGRSPAGAFALDTAFGFDIPQTVPWVRLPYVRLRQSTECVDDSRSAHYNTIVDRDSVPRVDWTSAERMREIEQYAFGVHVAYNAPPRPSRGSCIFLHVWAGPSSVTAGCTAMDERALRELMGWIDPQRRPMLVQLPAGAVARMRDAWRLP